MAVWSNTLLSTIKTQFGRFDAEFYKPEFLDTDRALSVINGVELRGVASKIDVGHVGPMVRHYSETGVLLLQTQNVREFFLELDTSVRVTPAFHASFVKSQVHRGNILIARSGSFGSAAIYLENAVINSADIIIVQIDDPRVNSLYAVTFMNTRYGFTQLFRFASGGVQGHVNLKILEHFRIPILNAVEQERVAENCPGGLRCANGERRIVCGSSTTPRIRAWSRQSDVPEAGGLHRAVQRVGANATL